VVEGMLRCKDRRISSITTPKKKQHPSIHPSPHPPTHTTPPTTHRRKKKEKEPSSKLHQSPNNSNYYEKKIESETHMRRRVRVSTR